MSDWALSDCEQQEFSLATASRGAAHTKGSYAQLTAATTFQYSAITLSMFASGGGGQTYLVDIAVGAAASEVIIVPNILVDSARAVQQASVCITIPVYIPAGTRLSVRCQDAGGAGTRSVDVALIGRAGGFNYTPCSGVAVNYGADTAATTGVLVDPGGVANTFGAWTEITAATSRKHDGLIAVLGTNKQTGSLVSSMYVFELAVGAAASEVAIATYMTCMNSSSNEFGSNSFSIGADIPEGTRLSMRSKCVASGLAAARHPTAIIVGY